MGRWDVSRKANDRAQQAIKYQHRDGWFHSDPLRLAHPLHAYPAQVHLSLLRLRHCREGLAEFTLLRCRRTAFRQIADVLPAVTAALLRPRSLTRRSDDFLAWTSCGANGAHQSPVFAGLPIDRAAIAHRNMDVPMPHQSGVLQRAVLHYKPAATSPIRKPPAHKTHGPGDSARP